MSLHLLHPALFHHPQEPGTITDKIRHMWGAPVAGNRGGDVAVSKLQFQEPASSGSQHYDSSITTTFVDKYVPIPFLHGDQQMSGHA